LTESCVSSSLQLDTLTGQIFDTRGVMGCDSSLPNGNVPLKIQRLRPEAMLPVRATASSSGLDLFACPPDGSAIELSPDPVLVPSGIAIEIPHGYDAQVRPRSGLGRRGVMVVFGTVDADYRGELFVTMYTFGSLGSYTIHHGDRIAQLVVARLTDVSVEEVKELSDTERGAGGHGSTGMR
jgi:dUTP pyrophosphatase